jgi:hypothetical protein
LIGWAASALVLSSRPASAAARSERDALTAAVSGRPLLEYRATPNPNKVYVARLFSPTGVQVLLDSPPDHVHHHGLMFALDVAGTSFWTDGEKEGVQKPRRPATLQREGTRSTIAHELDWVAPDGRVVLEERRTIVGEAPEDRTVTLLTWTSRLVVPKGGTTTPLATERPYVGLGLRLPKSMDTLARFVFPDGKDATPVRNTEKVTRDRWTAGVGPVDGRTVTVAMFDHPGNLRHPAAWFTMSDALTYMTATLNLHRQPLAVEPGRPLELRYGVAVWDGAASVETIEALYRAWAGRTPAPGRQ